ncbi:conserved hypothetical protein [Nostocoides japonicum T1-X7]|uniref:TIGR03089 family protein n=1 Tax=Nostocoides japonicum T1-X7 TaxID=1194083 RepID=A0A077M163_9MICO|nr:TIGR03089 family protein [Tetrasphaera japonica]CCH79561.1 conserved hypothetical protein [Tetrasphaera japonica T1-X7]
MRTPADVLADLVTADPGRPRITMYDDTPGGGGERVELSARVLANWVAKAGNALQEEWDAAPGSRIRLALPPHWRAVYWAFATWSVGACVVLGEQPDVDLVVSDDVRVVEDVVGDDGAAVLVSLPSLARAATVVVPAGAMDEAKELATYADQLAPWAEPSRDDPALDADGEHTAYETIIERGGLEPGARVHTRTTDLGALLRTVLAAWAVRGSVVLTRGAPDEARLAARLAAEAVTVDLP